VNKFGLFRVSDRSIVCASYENSQTFPAHDVNN